MRSGVSQKFPDANHAINIVRDVTTLSERFPSCCRRDLRGELSLETRNFKLET